MLTWSCLRCDATGDADDQDAAVAAFDEHTQATHPGESPRVSFTLPPSVIPADPPPAPTALDVASALVQAVNSAADFPTAQTNLQSVYNQLSTGA